MSRDIKPEMVAWLDMRLKGNGVAQEAIAKKDARQIFIEAARACVGIREEGGNNSGPLVELIQSTLGKAELEPWCMGFVQTLIAYAEIKSDRPSRVAASEHCLTVLHETPVTMRVQKMPLPGAIVIWRYQGTMNGHTGIVMEMDETTFKAIEGNTEAGVSPFGTVERDGGGVYLTRRNKTGTGKMLVQAFLKPF